MYQDGRCQKCLAPADVWVTMGFAPGGAETLRLCDEHALEMYLVVARWFGGQPPYRRAGDAPRRFGGQMHHDPKAEEAMPAYAKAAW